MTNRLRDGSASDVIVLPIQSRGTSPAVTGFASASRRRLARRTVE